MKNILAIALLTLSSVAFAGTEIVYFAPFQQQVTAFQSHRPEQFQILSAALKQVPVRELVDNTQCEGLDTLAENPWCQKRTVLESVEAVEVNITYYEAGISSDDPWMNETIYLRPSEVNTSAIAALQADRHHRLNARQASRVFAISTAPFSAVVPTIDYANSNICEDTLSSGCVQQVSYTTTAVNKIRISVVNR